MIGIAGYLDKFAELARERGRSIEKRLRIVEKASEEKAGFVVLYLGKPRGR